MTLKLTIVNSWCPLPFHYFLKQSFVFQHQGFDLMRMVILKSHVLLLWLTGSLLLKIMTMELGSEGETSSFEIQRGYSVPSYYLMTLMYLCSYACFENPVGWKYSGSFWNNIIIANRQDKLWGRVLVVTDCKCLESSPPTAFTGTELVWGHESFLMRWNRNWEFNFI